MKSDFYKITIYKTADRFLPYSYKITRGSSNWYIESGWSSTQSRAVKSAKKALQKRTKKLMFKEVESFIVSD